MDLSLGGRATLVTGASKGIGLAVARALAAEGAGPIHLASRDADVLATRAREIADEFGIEAVPHATDLSRRGAAEELCAACGAIDILVNNAGSVPRGTILEIDEETWRQAWDLKVFGYINMMRETYRAMKARGNGVIVNVVGNSGERPSAPFAATGAANAALIWLTESIGGESIKDGIRVLGVNPGPTTTDRFIEGAKNRAEARLGDGERWAETFASLPMGRPAHPEEVADMVAFLASDRASYITGTLVRIDAGFNTRPPQL